MAPASRDGYDARVGQRTSELKLPTMVVNVRLAIVGASPSAVEMFVPIVPRRGRGQLLDEITTDLDLIARQDLLAFLREETERPGQPATILYATHIFDTLDRWATHVVYLAAGKVVIDAPIGAVSELASDPLVTVVERWLRRDLGRR